MRHTVSATHAFASYIFCRRCRNSVVHGSISKIRILLAVGVGDGHCQPAVAGCHIFVISNLWLIVNSGIFLLMTVLCRKITVDHETRV